MVKVISFGVVVVATIVVAIEEVKIMIEKTKCVRRKEMVLFRITESIEKLHTINIPQSDKNLLEDTLMQVKTKLIHDSYSKEKVLFFADRQLDEIQQELEKVFSGTLPLGSITTIANSVDKILNLLDMAR
jgi:hypothetical protein